MTTLRTAAKAALWAFELHVQMTWPTDRSTAAIAALRAALAQQDAPEAYGYASRLAVAIWEKHYKDTAPQWKPLDYLIGVLTQIDNMTSGLTRQAQQAEPVEPVAWMRPDNRVAEESYSRTQFSRGRDKPPIGTWTPLYTTPPQRLPLTEEEINAEWHELDGESSALFKRVIRKFARAIERAHGIGEQP